MPKIRERYFPVAQKINRDPEVRQLKHELGLTGFSMWLQVLAETDGQKGLWKGSAVDIGGVLAGVCESNTRGSARFLQWVTDRCWIGWQNGSAIDSWSGLIVAKYIKYHGLPEEEKIPESLVKNPSLPNLPNLPNLPSLPSEIKNAEPTLPSLDREPPPIAPSAGLDETPKPKGLEPALKAMVEPIYRSNPEKFTKLILWVKDKQKRDYPEGVMIAALGAFWEQERKTKIKDWWPYLEKIFTKEYGRWSEAQAAKQKEADGQFVRDLVSSTARSVVA